MSCELCNKIWNGGLKEYKESIDHPSDYSDVIYKSNENYYLFIPCDDWYYNCVIDIHYCPKCGRKLIGG